MEHLKGNMEKWSGKEEASLFSASFYVALRGHASFCRHIFLIFLVGLELKAYMLYSTLKFLIWYLHTVGLQKPLI
jgi:hypothetical protein